MTLYENWIRKAYRQDGKSNTALWDEFAPLEQKIYEYILGEKVEKFEYSVKDIGEKFNMTSEFVIGFLDGINDSLEEKINIEEIAEDSNVSFSIDFKTLYKKMVEYKAEDLYTLPQWDGILSIEERELLFKEQKSSKTYVRDEKVGRNDPCPCGSGKKYKKCCGVEA